MFLEIVILVLKVMLFNFKLRNIDLLHCIHQKLLFLLVDSMTSEKKKVFFFHPVLLCAHVVGGLIKIDDRRPANIA
jgi:hypothetical protein